MDQNQMELLLRGLLIPAWAWLGSSYWESGRKFSAIFHWIVSIIILLSFVHKALTLN